MPTSVREVAERFHQAQQARRKDLHNPDKARALQQARAEWDEHAEQLRARLPFRTRKHGEAGHLAVVQTVELHEGTRFRGHALCGQPIGPPRRGSPPACLECLLTAERYLSQGPPPLELPL